MQNILHLLILVLVFLLGIMSVRSPMKIASFIVLWAKFVSGNSASNPMAREAFQLMDNEPDEYARRFYFQLATIRRTGIIALIISVIGSCLIVFGNK